MTVFTVVIYGGNINQTRFIKGLRVKLVHELSISAFDLVILSGSLVSVLASFRHQHDKAES